MTDTGVLPGCSMLIVDDDELTCRSFARALRRAGYDTTTASQPSEALDLVAANTYDALLSDLNMPEMSGVELLRRVREIDPDLPVLLITGAPTVDSASQAVEHGAARYLPKPVPPSTLVQAVGDAVRLGQSARLQRIQLEKHVTDSQRQLRERTRLEQSFEAALEELYVAFQPIVDMKTRRVFGYEALLRTDHEPLRNPLAFLEAAEQLDEVFAIGRRVRDEAARRIVAAPAGTLAFVNLHAADLHDDTLFDPTTALSRVAHRVVLEITERVSLDRMQDVPRRLEQLRSLGFRIAVDDLGAGYAGLSALALFRPNVVKFDMSLVRDIHKDATKQVLVRAMVRLAGELGARVVAEGVENELERDCVVDLGGDLLQGYFFARPGRDHPEPDDALYGPHGQT